MHVRKVLLIESGVNALITVSKLSKVYWDWLY
jgi:hypothetical protein